eukprot:5614727-Amphidinium_carterae.3
MRTYFDSSRCVGFVVLSEARAQRSCRRGRLLRADVFSLFRRFFVFAGFTIDALRDFVVVLLLCVSGLPMMLVPSVTVSAINVVTVKKAVCPVFSYPVSYNLLTTSFNQLHIAKEPTQLIT